jgi:hypothetical protein
MKQPQMHTDKHRLSGAIGPKRRIGLIVAVIGAACVLSAQEKAHKMTTVSMRKLADSVHAIIAADQQAYAELASARTAANNKTRAGEALPSHAQVLRQAAQSIQKKGAEFSYTLRSLTPLSPAGAPQTAAEQEGLAFVASHPKENFYTEEQLGGRSYFTAVYAERATAGSCVECHNQHPQSPGRDLKVGDIMGAVVVRVPMEF